MQGACEPEAARPHSWIAEQIVFPSNLNHRILRLAAGLVRLGVDGKTASKGL
jgi:hypothetical protein